MTFKSLAYACHPLHYNTITPIENIDTENVQEEQNNYWNSMLEYLQKKTKKCSEVCKYIGTSILSLIMIIFLIFIGLLAIYFIFTIIGLIFVLFCIFFENIVVYIFGRGAYNKYFPVCTDTRYTNNNCYTTTSTYCS
jgi:hypothetical protein